MRSTMLLLLLASCLGLAAAQGGDCAAQLQAAGEAAGVDTPTFYVDPDTPADACTKQMCTGDYVSCDSDPPPQTDLQLVFSDEFEAAGQAFGVAEANPRWTAEHIWYAGTQDFEVYLPEQVGSSGLVYWIHSE
jgi:hypothetical protein